MAKKNRQNNDNSQEIFQDVDASFSEEESQDEEDENEEGESEDVFAEDESDIAMIRKLEEEESEKALSTIAFDEEVGFNPMYDWDSVPESEKQRFATLKEMSREDLEVLDWKSQNPYQKWMIARACARVGLHAKFREIATGLVEAKKQAAELCIEDIYLELIWDYIDEKVYDDALKCLDKFEKKFEKEKRAALMVRGLVLMAQGEISAGKSLISKVNTLTFNRDIPGFETDRSYSDVDRTSGSLQYEVGCSLLNMGMFDLALQYFDDAKMYAQMNNNYELIMAIDNALALTNRRKNGDMTM